MIDWPPYMDPEVVAGYISMRRAKGQRAPWTDRAQTLLIGKLEAFHADGWCPNYLLDEATLRGWTSVFMVPDCPRIRPIRAEAPHDENPPVEDPAKHAAVMEKVRRLGSKLRAA